MEPAAISQRVALANSIRLSTGEARARGRRSDELISSAEVEPLPAGRCSRVSVHVKIALADAAWENSERKFLATADAVSPFATEA
jgi:hypothetical protein